MKIIKTFNWNRRDFCAEMKCENCQHEQTESGMYDDVFYYENVVPQIKCINCGESTNSKPTDVLKTINIPRYPSHLNI